MNRLRALFEKIVYAGMKPGMPHVERPGLRWLGPLREPVERMLNGSASKDPFYLSNRTTGQKARLAALVVIPFAVLVVGVYLASSGAFDKDAKLPPPVKPLTAEEVAAKILPDLKKDLKVETNQDIQVLDVAVHQSGGSKVSGSVRNTTGHVISDAEVVFELTDARGSRVERHQLQIRPASAPQHHAV